jgi:ribonuclease BN (tRNA processing enzyme)
MLPLRLPATFETSGLLPGYTFTAQAGKVAAQAEVDTLFLIHYPTAEYSASRSLAEARMQYENPMTMVKDLVSIRFD